MAAPQISSLSSRPALPAGFRRLGLLNGLVLGLSLAVGMWAFDVIRLARLPVRLQLPTILLGALLLVTLCALTGWLSAGWQRGGLVALAWLLYTGLAALVIAYLPSYGRTVTVWLVDRRFWGRWVYPPPAGLTPVIALIAALFLFLLLLVLALLQSYRLEAIQVETTDGTRLSSRAWILLLLPAPLAIGAGLLTGEMNSDPSAIAVQQVHQAIEVVRGYDGDLFARGLEDGISYSALRGVRDRLEGPYSLTIGGTDPALSTTFVIAYFESGAWIGCRVINDQLSFCEDAAISYTSGFADLIAGVAAPDGCVHCRPVADAVWTEWLQSRQADLGPNPQIARLAQWGGDVLMEVRAAEGDFAVRCWFEGFRPVRLESCSE